MAKSLNLCQFIGNLGNDPEIKYMPNGNAVANLSIGVSDDYKDKNTNQAVQQTNWIRVVAYGRLAEIIGEYTRKGSKIYISGKQVTRKWQDNNRQDRYTTEIVANEMQMLDSRQDNAGAPQQQRPAQQQNSRPAPPQNQPMGAHQAAAMDSFDDDIAF